MHTCLSLTIIGPNVSSEKSLARIAFLLLLHCNGALYTTLKTHEQKKMRATAIYKTGLHLFVLAQKKKIVLIYEQFLQPVHVSLGYCLSRGYAH